MNILITFCPEVQSVHHLPRAERYVERSFDVDLSPGLLAAKIVECSTFGFEWGWTRIYLNRLLRTKWCNFGSGAGSQGKDDSFPQLWSRGNYDDFLLLSPSVNFVNLSIIYNISNLKKKFVALTSFLFCSKHWFQIKTLSSPISNKIWLAMFWKRLAELSK